jgi:hypothetical protein
MEARRPGLTRRACVLALAVSPLALQAQTVSPIELAAELPGATLRGSGRMSFFGLHIYDIRLWTAEGFGDYATSPLALEIEYARALVGKLIADRSLSEMKRTGEIADDQAERWLAAMRRAFPDVKKGDRITGVHQPGIGARFFVNGAFKDEIRDADFARRFFGIWLAPQTSEPRLREQLLGLAKPKGG